MGPGSRLAPAACATLAAFALALPGCGEEAPAASGGGVAKPSKAAARAPRPASGGGRCAAQLGAFVGSLNALRRRLVAGLTYDQYSREVQGLRKAYGAIPVDRLDPSCLIAAGTPSEKAFDGYLEAANDWGECLSEPGCGAASVEAPLQRIWRAAAVPLAAASRGLAKRG